MSESAKISETDCAYLAALIDHLGEVKIRSERRAGTVYRTLVLQLLPVQEDVADWIRSKFGFARSVWTPEGLRITFVTRKAAEICVHAYPYLFAKKAEARLVTRFAQSVGVKGSPITPEKEAIRTEVDRELRALQAKAQGARR